MAEPQLRDMFGGPEYVGPVAAMRQQYHVFKTAKGDFAVFSRSNRSPMSFHMTFVPAARVEVLRRTIPRNGTTSKSLLKEKSVLEGFRDADGKVAYFDVLTALYVMAALGMVDIAKSGRHLVFSPRGEPRDE